MNPFRNKKHRLQAMRIVKDETAGKPEKPIGACRTFSEHREAFSQCPACKHVIATRIMHDQSMVCPSCGHYLLMPAPERLRVTFDRGRYFELDPDLIGCDPLAFPGYEHKLAQLRERTNLTEAVMCGVGRIGGHMAVVAALDSRFLMGSMGTAVGEKVTRAIEYATRKHLPLVIFSASGGARMQEGIFSLMQMAKTAAALARHDAAGLLYVSVMTHPTTGGVTASFASLGDVLLAEPGALIGFAGPRVIEQTIGQKLPEGFQRAESLLHDGFLDAVVERRNMNEALARIIRFASSKSLRLKTGTQEHPATSNRTHDSSPEKQTTGEAVRTFGGCDGDIANPPSPACRLALARDRHRPHIDAYLENLFEDFFELHGDRCFKDDGSIVGGIGCFGGAPVMVIGQRKGNDVQTNIACNFGMPQPEGYRKVQRLARMAGKFGRPIITFIDTPGAYPGIEAEQRGQGEAIASCLALFAQVKCPVVAVVAGEGGSGGALALGVADSVIMLENAVYAVLSPEGFAAILWKDRSRAAEACEIMKITAADLHGFGVIDRIVAEGPGGIQMHQEEAFMRLAEAIAEELTRLSTCDTADLLETRYRRFRSIGAVATRPKTNGKGDEKE